MDIEQAYKEYFSVVYRYVLSLSRDPAVAEEVTQETFFKAMRTIGSFRGDCSIRTWLCQIAKNGYYDLVRRHARTVELPEEFGDAAASPEDDLGRRADAWAIAKALHSLKEPYKEVFALRAYGEMDYASIAELFGKTASWARVTFHRARMMIREELDDGTR